MNALSKIPFIVRLNSGGIKFKKRTHKIEKNKKLEASQMAKVEQLTIYSILYFKNESQKNEVPQL